MRFWVLGFQGFATYPNFKVLGFQGLATIKILRSWVFRVSLHIKILRSWVSRVLRHNTILRSWVSRVPRQKGCARSKIHQGPRSWTQRTQDLEPFWNLGTSLVCTSVHHLGHPLRYLGLRQKTPFRTNTCILTTRLGDLAPSLVMAATQRPLPIPCRVSLASPDPASHRTPAIVRYQPSPKQV